MRSYVVNVVNGETNIFAEPNFISYNAPKLVMGLHPNDRDKIELLRQHAAQHSVMNFQIECHSVAVRHVSTTLSGLRQTMNHGEDELWISPNFRAEVTSAGQPPLHVELRVLDDVDLSGLK
jgi:hypothetical protein